MDETKVAAHKERMRGQLRAERVFRVVAERHDGDLCASVPDLPGVHTFAPDQATLDGYVREAIALILDLPAGTEAALSLTYEYAER